MEAVQSEWEMDEAVQNSKQSKPIRVASLFSRLSWVDGCEVELELQKEIGDRSGRRTDVSVE